MATFERVLWRVLRGNLYMNVRDPTLARLAWLVITWHSTRACLTDLLCRGDNAQSAEIDDSVLPVPSTAGASSDSTGDEDKKLRKNAFIIFAHGSDLLDKIRKIAECEPNTWVAAVFPAATLVQQLTGLFGRCRVRALAAMGANLFAIDSSSDKRSDKLREVTSRIEDLNSVLYNTNQTRRAELVKIADSISAWWALVRKEKVIFSTLNLWKWDQGKKTLVAEGWVPTRDIPQIQNALRSASVRAVSHRTSRDAMLELG